MYRVGFKLFRSLQEAKFYASKRRNAIVSKVDGDKLVDIRNVPVLRPKQQGVELVAERPDEPEDERALALED